MSYIGAQPTTAAFVTDTFSANGSGTVFTLSVAPANTNSILVAVSGVLQDPATYSVSGTTLTFSAAPPAGTGNISVRFLGIPASGVVNTAYRTVTEFTATAGQTTFSVPSYTVGYIDVYRNGALLGSADFTATNGTTVVLTNAASAGDLVEVISFSVSSVLNAIPATTGSVTSTYLAPNLSLVTPTVTTTMGVGNATPSTSGAGITFPATQSASSDANTLDDYEEGTWSPTLTASSGSATYTANNSGTYQKIGNRVYCFGFLSLASSSLSGQIFIGGLPFTSSANTNLSVTPVLIGRANTWNTAPVGGAIVSSSSTTFELYKYSTGNNTTDSVGADTTASSSLYFSISYITA